MKILLSYTELQEVNKLLKTKESNIAIADLLNEFCLTRDENLYSLISEKTNANLSKKEALLKYYLLYFGVDTSYKPNKVLIDTYLKDCIKILNDKEFVENPYNLTVKPNSFSKNEYKLTYEEYPVNSVFPLDDISTQNDNYYLEKTYLGSFEKEYKYLTLFKNDEIWMCITPNEINTMKKAISSAHGNVVTYGLGLGYFAFMASNKSDVKSVTIIDNDKELINMFLTYICPFFPNKNKITIINDDAINHFIKHKNEFDYTFVDLWHNAEDGLPIYIEFIKNQKMRNNIDYWIENSLIALYRRCILTVVEESLNGAKDSMYRKYKNSTDKIINEIYFKTKNLEIKKSSDLYALLSDDSIKNLIKN